MSRLPLTQSITIRLADALPVGTMGRWAGELLAVPAARRRAEFTRRLDAELDAGSGACWLASRDIAEVVASAIRFHHGRLYRLHAWALMPNHVHLLLTPAEGVHVGRILHALKSWTVHELTRRFPQINAPFWAEDYFDRFVRDERHLRAVVDYVLRNPVSAGLEERFRTEPWTAFVTIDGARPAATFDFTSGRDGLTPRRGLDR